MTIEDIEFDLSCMDPVGRMAISDGLEEQCFGFGGTEQEFKVRREQWMAIRYQAEYAARYNAPLEISIPINDKVSIEFVLIPPGEFMMGSPDDCQYASADEKPQHRVRIQNPYWIAKYPVTQAQYEALIGTNPSHFKNDEDSPERPVECVNWYDSREFCNRLTDLLPQSLKGRKVRLPLEAEWEYACRAGTTTLFPWGDSCDGTEANVDGRYPIPNNSPKGPYLGRTCRVGMYAPNHWGLHDMIGQVWEWCLDRYVADAYKKRAEQGVYGVGEGEQSSPFVNGAVHGLSKPMTAEPLTATTLPLLLELADTSASDQSLEGEQSNPFVFCEVTPGTTTPGTAVPPIAASTSDATLISDSDQSSEGEQRFPFVCEEAGTHSIGIAARTTETLAMPATCSTTTASDQLLEGENGFPLGSLGDAISPARLKVDHPLIVDGISQIVDTNTTALDPLSEGEDRTPFDHVFAADHGIVTLVAAIPLGGIGIPSNAAIETSEAESNTSASDPSSDEADSVRCLRGGSWFNNASICHSALRFRGDDGCSFNDRGFRPVIS